MLSYSGITVLSFSNKVVKIQPRKFIRSSYGVPRTLQYEKCSMFPSLCKTDHPYVKLDEKHNGDVCLGNVFLT